MQSYNVTDTASIFQMNRTGDTETYGNSPAYTNINMGITPAGTDIQMTYGGLEGFQIYEIFIYDITLNLTNGDKIVAQSGTYLIAGIPMVVNNRYMKYIKVVGRKVV